MTNNCKKIQLRKNFSRPHALATNIQQKMFGEIYKDNIATNINRWSKLKGDLAKYIDWASQASEKDKKDLSAAKKDQSGPVPKQ